MTEEINPSEPRVIATVGGPVDEVGVSIVLYGENLDPEYVTKLIGRTPTRGHRKGDCKRKGAVPYRVGAWILEERGNAPVTVDELIERLLMRVPDDDRLWQRLAAEFDLQFRFGIHMLGWNRGFGISTSALQRLARMGVSLEFDIYADEPDA